MHYFLHLLPTKYLKLAILYVKIPDTKHFKKFVKQGFYQEDWCNFDDKNDVLNMDLE